MSFFASFAMKKRQKVSQHIDTRIQYHKYIHTKIENDYVKVRYAIRVESANSAARETELQPSFV